MKNTNLVKNNKRLKEELDEVIGRDELYTPRITRQTICRRQS